MTKNKLFPIVDILPRRPVEWLTEALLIESMPDESDRASEDEESVEYSSVDIHLYLGWTHPDRDEYIKEGRRYMAIHIEDEIRSLLQSQSLNGESIVEMYTRWDRFCELFQNITATIRIEFALHFVTDSLDRIPRFFHTSDEIFGGFLLC